MMEYLSLEALEEGSQLVFSDEEHEKETDELDNFIGDRTAEQNVSFYRRADPSNINAYLRFHGQTRNPIQAI